MFKFLKKKNDYFIKMMETERRNKLIAVFFKNLSELYASDATGIQVECKNFELIDSKFYFEVGKEILKKLDNNLSIERCGVDDEEAIKSGRYFLIKINE